MSGTFQLVLDTQGPQGVTLALDGGAAWATDRVVTAIPGTSSSDAVLMKIWGDVDAAADANVQPTEAASAWVAYGSYDITLAAGDGTKNVTIRLRDDVGNTSSTASDSITLDTSAPVVTIVTGPATTAGGSPPKLSKVSGFDDASITWQADSTIQAYKVKYVPATGSLESEGTQIPTTGGSTNVNVSGVGIEPGNQVTTHVKGVDLETASANGDGAKQLKIFVQDLSGTWSVA